MLFDGILHKDTPRNKQVLKDVVPYELKCAKFMKDYQLT